MCSSRNVTDTAMGDGNGITNRELFKELVEQQKLGTEARLKTVEVLKGMDSRLEIITDRLDSHMWRLLIILILALLAVVGIKLALPGLA